MKETNALDFVRRGLSTIVDVRSPSEYLQGHIPGAINLPLFDDEERAVVGIEYKQRGQRDAVIKGLELVGPKLSHFVRSLENADQEKEVGVYCWRGGMRSAGMAWLFENSGYRTVRLNKGYKAFRGLAKEIFEQFDLILIGGETGAGKTAVLQELRSVGEQVVDLEDLACHKGSAFGGIGETTQPSTEHFQNLVLHAFSQLDPTKPVYLEDESSYIGKVGLSETLWRKMKQSPLVHLQVPRDLRVKTLVDVYGGFDKALLEEAIQKISRKLGGQNAKNAIELLYQNRLDLVANEMLRYYDKSYRFLLERNQHNIVLTIQTESSEPRVLAQQVLSGLTNLGKRKSTKHDTVPAWS